MRVHMGFGLFATVSYWGSYKTPTKFLFFCLVIAGPSGIEQAMGSGPSIYIEAVSQRVAT